MKVCRLEASAYRWSAWLITAWLALWLCAPAHAQSDPPLHPDGWDLTFGGEGRAELDCVNGKLEQVYLHADNTITVAAVCPHPQEPAVTKQLTLLRLTADGDPDAAFGVNGRVLVTNLPAYTYYQTLITTQSDGKTIVAQALLAGMDAITGYQISRYQNNGGLDRTFGNQGVLTVTVASLRQDSDALFALPDNKILLYAGETLWQFTPAGSIDNTFHNTGSLTASAIITKPVADAKQSLMGVAIQPDGKIVVRVEMDWLENNFDQTPRGQSLLARLQPDGSLDPSFADDGLYLLHDDTAGRNYGCIPPTRLQANSKLVTIDTRGAFQLIRLETTGERDQTLTTPAQSCDFQLGVADSLLFIDDMRLADNYPIRLIRLTAAGERDTSFGNNGELALTMAGFVGLQQDGSSIVWRWSKNGNPELLRNHKTKSAPAPAPTAAQKPLALIYAVLDNNLGEEWLDLFNKIEAGVHANLDVRLLLDGPGANDAYVYQMQEDHNPYCPSTGNPTCNGRYVDGTNRWQFFTEDSAQPTSLYQFVLDSLQAYPQAPQVTLALVGHGSGWGANVLPAQPSFWKKQNDTLGGMLWDDHTGGQSGTRSLSTLGLAAALRGVQAETGRQIDLLYLDGCSMGMTEIAYELAGAARYLLASPNTDWATFSYDQLLAEVKVGVDARTLGQRWLAREAALLRSQPGHPFTLALTDLQQVGQFSTTVSALGNALQASLPTQRAQIVQAFAASDRFDSNYDAKLDQTDSYIDLKDFAERLQQVGLTSGAVISAAQQVETVLASVVISTAYTSGVPWVAEEESWAWQTMGGLSIYAPLGQDEAKRRIYYNGNNLTWAADSTWDEFLNAFWVNNSTGVTVATTTGEMPVCLATTDRCTGLATPQPTVQHPEQTLYLTFVSR